MSPVTLKSHLTIMQISPGQISIFSKQLLVRRNTADTSGRSGRKKRPVQFPDSSWLTMKPLGKVEMAALERVGK